MLDVYRQGRGPQPLGTVVFEEIEAKAREKLKDYGGQCLLSSKCLFDHLQSVNARCFHVRWWKCWYIFHLSRQSPSFR